MFKKHRPKENLPSLYSKDWDKPKSPSFDPNFFKNFTIAINNINNQPKHYYFKPWDENQKDNINIALNVLKDLFSDYNHKKESKNYKYVSFPGSDLKTRALSTLNVFFQPANLILDENIDNRFNRYKNIEQQKQSTIDERRVEAERIVSNIPKGDKKFWDAFGSLFNTLHKPENDDQLKDHAKRDEYVDQTKLCDEIIKETFKYFFPKIAGPHDGKHHKIVSGQVKVFIDTIEHALNNIV